MYVFNFFNSAIVCLPTIIFHVPQMLAVGIIIVHKSYIFRSSEVQIQWIFVYFQLNDE